MKKQRSSGLTHVSELLPGLLPEEPKAIEAAHVKPVPQLPPDIITGELIRSEDIAYTHSLFVQCFMPVRHHKTNAQEWECGNRNAKLAITAGKLINPAVPGEFKRCVVPAGGMARLVVAYINNFIYHKKTPVIDLGESLRKAMERMQIPIAGTNGKALTHELENFAAADITLGLWLPDGSAHQEQAKVARRLSFWIEKDPKQGTLWRPEMTVSDEYFQSVMHSAHVAPVYMPDYVKLRKKPRAQDVYTWLCYRLRTPLKRSPTVIPAAALHTVFGQDIKQRKHFWAEFKKAVAAAHECYPEARVEFGNDCFKLYSSPARIPYRKLEYIG